MKQSIFNIIRLSDKPLKVSDIEKLTGIDRNTIQKIVNDLAVEGKIELDRCYNKILRALEDNNNE